MSNSNHRRSVTGRPRALTDAQIADVLVWHGTRLTLKQKAAQLDISPTTLQNVIRSRGEHYKQASPEQRASTLSAARARRAELRAVGLM